MLALTSATNTISANQVSSIETLTISQTTNASTGTGVVVGATGVTKVVNSGSTVGLIVSGLDTVGAVDVTNTAQNTTVIYADTAVTGAADTATVALNNVTGAAQVNLNSATANTVGIETVALTSNGSVANSITLTTNDTAGLSKVTIGGSAALTLALGTNVTTTATTIDGSAATGALTISGFGTAAHTVTGGTGADRFQFAGSLGATDTINGGGGVDTLSANGAQLASFTTTSKPTVSNIETIELANDVGAVNTAIDTALFGTINNIRVADQGSTNAAAIAFNNIAAVATGSNNIRIDGDLGASGGTIAFNIANATNAGTANAVTFDMRGGATTGTSTLSVAGVETVTIDTTNATGAQTFNLTDPALTSLTIKGGQNVNLSGAALGTVVATVDASGLTGTATANVVLSNTAVNGATVTGGANADTFVGTQLADTITGGNGGDTITGAGGIDTIILTETTAATDTVKISVAGAAGVDRDIVKGFTAGATNGDVFNFNSGVAALTGTNNFADASSLQTHNLAGNLVTAAAAEVIAVTTATIADVTSTNSLNGTNLLAAIGGTITGAVTGQNDLLFAVGVAGGGTAIYYASSADNAIIASEITLVGVLEGVSVGSLVVGNFANAA